MYRIWKLFNSDDFSIVSTASNVQVAFAEKPQMIKDIKQIMDISLISWKD